MAGRSGSPDAPHRLDPALLERAVRSLRRLAQHLPALRRPGLAGLRPGDRRPGIDLAARRHLSSRRARPRLLRAAGERSEEHTSELQSLMRISYAVFCLNKKKTYQIK